MLAGASSLLIEYRGPNNITGNWTAIADVTDAYYDLSDAIITTAGKYQLQVVAVINTLTRRSAVVSATFSTPL